jgi:hypothetical protein
MNSNSTAISIGALILCLVLSHWVTPTADASDTASANGTATYDNTSVSGTITCSSSVELGPTALATGTINVVADGKGNLTSGNARYHGGPGAPGTSCNYALSSGTYTVQSDGSGQATTNWSLISQSSSTNCAATVSQNAISFWLKNSTFSAPTSASRSESGNCSLAAAP